MGVFIFIVLIAIVAASILLGVKFCVFLADIFGIDSRYIPRRTYCANGLFIGFLIGVLILVSSGSWAASIIVGLLVGAGAMIGIFFIEVAIMKAVTPLSDKVEAHLADRINNYTGSNSSFSDTAERKVEANQWRCPKCQTINPRYVTSCGCGFLLSDLEKAEKEEKEARIKRQEEIKEQQRIEEEKRKKQQDELLSRYDNLELSSAEELAIKLVARSDEGYNIQEMCRMLPRSVVVQDFRDAIGNLLKLGIIEKDDEERFHLAENSRIDSKGGESHTEPAEDDMSIQAGVENFTSEKAFYPDKQNSGNDDKYEEIRKYKALLDEGVITESDYAKKKKELLGL